MKYIYYGNGKGTESLIILDRLQISNLRQEGIFEIELFGRFCRNSPTVSRDLLEMLGNHFWTTDIVKIDRITV